MKITDEMVEAFANSYFPRGKTYSPDLVRAALSAALAAQDSLNIPDNWLPTSENINALPRPVRDYIMRLHANTDPAGELSRAMVAEMERDALRKMMEWQPIETALCDDSDALVYFERPGAAVMDVVNLDHDSDPAWWKERGATHWMPLPETPDVGR